MTCAIFPERPLSRLPRAWALVVIALAVAAILWGAAETSQGVLQRVFKEGVEQNDPQLGDLPMYRRVADRVAAGEGYYAVAADEHRKAGYPTSPFVTVRQPTVAWLYAIVGERGLMIALSLLAIANALAWPAILPARMNRGERFGFGVMILAGSAILVYPDISQQHELWVGMLLSLAIALYRPRNWWPSLLLLAVALAIREIALPFALLWCAFALYEKRWHELTALAAVLVLFAGGLALHAVAVHAVVRTGDLVSAGWSGLQGPMLYVDGMFRRSLLLLLPQALVPAMLTLSLLGYASWGGRQGWFSLLWLTGIIAMVSLFAREDNWYWAVLTLPMALGGLALAPRAIADLFVALREARPTGTNTCDG